MNPASPTPTAQGPTMYGPFLGPLELHAPIGGRISKYASIICPAGDAEMGNWMVAERVRWDSYAEYMILAVNSHARLTAENERLRAALVQARATFQSWTGPLRESAEYMQSQDVFPGTVRELLLAADFQQKAIAAIDSALTTPSGLADAPLLPQSAGTLGDRTL